MVTFDYFPETDTLASKSAYCVSASGSRAESPGGRVPTRLLPVQFGNTQVLVEVVESSGPQNVGMADVMSFDGVRHALEAITSELARIWEQVKPAEASVELGVKLTTKSGKLTALIVEGGGEATLKVTLKWKS
jgi:hypothetical protein